MNIITQHQRVRPMTEPSRDVILRLVVKMSINPEYQGGLSNWLGTTLSSKQHVNLLSKRGDLHVFRN